MALDFKNVPLLFNGGLDATDDFILSPHKTTVLTDAVFDDSRTVKTRGGQYLLNLAPKVASIPAPYARTNPSLTGLAYRMSQHLGNLLTEGAEGLFSRGPYDSGPFGSDTGTMLRASTNTAVASIGRTDFNRSSVETEYVGSIPHPGITGFSPFSYIAGQSVDFSRIENYDALGRDMTFWAWQEVDNTGANFAIHMRAFDEGDRSQGVARTQVFDLSIPGPYMNVRVLSNATEFFVVAVDINSGAITVLLKLVASTGVVTYPNHTAFIVPGSTKIYDAIMDPVNGCIVLAYQTGATTLRISRLNTGATAEASGSARTITADPASVTLVYALSPGVNRYIALYTCIGTETVIRSVYFSFQALAGLEAVVFTAAQTVGRITGVDHTSAATDFTVFYDHDVTTPGIQQGVYQLLAPKAGGAATNSGGIRGIAENAHIYARPTVITATNIQLPCCYLLDYTFPSLFVVRASTSGYPASVQKTVVSARIHWGQTGSIVQCWNKVWILPTTYLMPSGNVVMPAPRLSAQATAVAGRISAETQVWQASMSLTTQDLGYAESNRDTLLAGSCPQVFDGSYFSEDGFNHRPIIFSAAPSGGGGLAAATTYTVRATYIREDSQGNTIESAPSDPVTFTTVGAWFGYLLSVLPYGITSSPNTRIRIYRSAGTSAVLYLDGSASATGGAGDTDAVITANTPLPTTGGVLPNQPMPACRVLVEHDKRLWAIGGEAGDTVYFSQPISQDIMPEWNRLLNRRVPRNAGRVVNAVSLDDKLVLFCENRIGFIYGNGPTRTGAQDGYSEFIEAVSGYTVPWTEPHAIVRCSDGVWFRSGFGVRLLGRSMQVVQDGDGDLASELDATFAGNVRIIRALVGTSGQAVRFYTQAGLVYVYDLTYKQWSTFTNFAAVDCTILKNDFYHVNNDVSSNAYLVVQSNLAFDDYGGVPITSTLTTGWLSFAGLQGYQRVSRVQLLAANVPASSAPMAISMTQCSDFNIDVVSSVIAPNSLFPNNNNGMFQVEAQLGTQKTESIRLSISWGADGSGTDCAIRLTALNFRVGLKKGRFKLPNTQKLG